MSLYHSEPFNGISWWAIPALDSLYTDLPQTGTTLWMGTFTMVIVLKGTGIATQGEFVLLTQRYLLLNQFNLHIESPMHSKGYFDKIMNTWMNRLKPLVKTISQMSNRCLQCNGYPVNKNAGRVNIMWFFQNQMALLASGWLWHGYDTLW